MNNQYRKKGRVSESLEGMNWCHWLKWRTWFPSSGGLARTDFCGFVRLLLTRLAAKEVQRIVVGFKLADTPSGTDGKLGWPNEKLFSCGSWKPCVLVTFKNKTAERGNIRYQILTNNRIQLSPFVVKTLCFFSRVWCHSIQVHIEKGKEHDVCARRIIRWDGSRQGRSGDDIWVRPLSTTSEKSDIDGKAVVYSSKTVLKQVFILLSVWREILVRPMKELVKQIRYKEHDLNWRSGSSDV